MLVKQILQSYLNIYYIFYIICVVMKAIVLFEYCRLNCVIYLHSWWEGRALVYPCKLRMGRRLWLLCPVALTKTDRTNELDST